MGNLYKEEYLDFIIIKLLPTTNNTNIFEDSVIFDYFSEETANSNKKK